MPKDGPKSGRLSNDEKAYIRNNAGQTHPQAIADALRRSLDVVLREMKVSAPAALGAVESEGRATIRLSLKQSPAWRRLTREFESDELEYFEEQYVALMDQFRDDVLATEETQIQKLIKYDIMMGRNAAQQKRVNREITRLERAQEEYVRANPDLSADPVKQEYLAGLDGQLQQTYSQLQSLTRELTTLDEKHQRLMKDLKGTREQRVDNIEAGKVDFFGVIRMLADESVRDAEDQQIAMMRRATAGELKRLATPHRFSDGVVDQPVLTPDTVKMLDDGVVSVPDFGPRRAAGPAGGGT